MKYGLLNQLYMPSNKEMSTILSYTDIRVIEY